MIVGQHERGAYLALVAVQLLFAALPVAGKVALGSLEPTVFVAIRVVGAALLLVALAWLVHRPELPSPSDLARLAIFAIFGVVLNQVLFIIGLDFTTAVNTSLLLTVIPVFTYLIALAMGAERIDLQRAAGILVAMGGVLVLLDPRRFDLSDEFLVGNLLILANTLAYSFYLVISRPILSRIEPLTVIAGVFTFGAAMVVPLALWQAPDVAAWQLEGRTAGVMAFVILGPTVSVYALNLFALARVPSSTVAAFIYLQPVTGVLLAAWLLGEAVPTRTILAGALVLLGVALVTLRRRGG